MNMTENSGFRFKGSTIISPPVYGWVPIATNDIGVQVPPTLPVPEKKPYYGWVPTIVKNDIGVQVPPTLPVPEKSPYYGWAPTIVKNDIGVQVPPTFPVPEKSPFYGWVPTVAVSGDEPICKCPEKFTEEEVRSALRVFEKGRHCSENLADTIDINSITMSEGHVYKAHAVLEHRKVKWQTDPYLPSMAIGGPKAGPPPPIQVWNIKVSPPSGYDFKHFKDILIYEIPNTAFKTDCLTCLKSGHIPCPQCDRTWINHCKICKGSGKTTNRSIGNKILCRTCKGIGKNSCADCDRSGLQPCTDCAGTYSVKKYQGFTVDWHVLIEKRSDGDIPEVELNGVTGERSVYHSGDFDVGVNPLAQCYNEGVREISKSVFQKFRLHIGGINRVGGKKIIKVRQIVVTILIAKVIATWKGKKERFYVFGKERKIYFPNGYPKCSFCSIT